MPKETGTQSVGNHDLRERIIEVAEKLFADKGFDGTSISDITEGAGVARALIYYYFKDKKGLHEAIVREGGKRILAVAMEAEASPGNALDKLRAFMALWQRMHLDHPNQVRVGMRARFEDDMGFEKSARETFVKVAAVLRRIIEDGIAQGDLRPVEPDMVMHIVIAMTHATIMHTEHKTGHSSDEGLEFAMSVLCHGIAARG